MSVEPVAVTIGTEIINGLSAIGAHEDAIGGAALAAGAAIKGTGWLISALKTRLPFFNRHYLGTSPAAQTQAAANVISVSQHIRKRFDEYVADGRLTEQQARDALDNPAFALFFNDAVLGASETDDDFIHEQFASLIIERMTKDHASVEAIAIRLATERLRDITSQQLKLLAAIFVAQRVLPYHHHHPEPFSSLEEYAELCSAEVRPHWDACIYYGDYWSLAAANTIDIRDTGLNCAYYCPMIAQADSLFPEWHDHPPEVFTRLTSWMEGTLSVDVDGARLDLGSNPCGFKQIMLKKTGAIIGNVVHWNMLGRGRRLDDLSYMREERL